MNVRAPMSERIMQAADRLFYRKGIRAVGVDSVAAEAGISKRSLYDTVPVEGRADCRISAATDAAVARFGSCLPRGRCWRCSISFMRRLPTGIFVAARSLMR